MITAWFEDLSVGQVVRTRARTVTEADVVTFAMLSGDWNPLHTDVEYAGQGPFAQRIAHGMLSLSIATGLVRLEVPYVVAFYGVDELRFVAPVFLGDTISVETTLIDTQAKPRGGGVATFEFVVQNQDQRVVLRCVMRFLVATRAAAQPESAVWPARVPIAGTS